MLAAARCRPPGAGRPMQAPKLRDLPARASPPR